MLEHTESLSTELLTGFCIGAFAVTALSFGADRFGSRLAGMFAGLPASVAAALYFLGTSTTATNAAEAAEIIPMVEGLRGLFVLTYAWLAPRGLLVSMISSFAGWFILAACISIYGPFSLAVSLGSLIVCLAFCLYMFKYVLQVEWQPGFKLTLRYTDIATRMLAGGSTVALAIYLGVALGPLFAGIMATFPTVVACTLFVIHLRSGWENAAAFGRSYLLNALSNTTAFSVAAHYAYEPFGMVWGTVIGLGAAVLSCCGCWLAMFYLHSDNTARPRVEALQ